MSEVKITVDFAHYEVRAKYLAKLGDFETAGLLLQAVEVMRELGSKISKLEATNGASETVEERPPA